MANQGFFGYEPDLFVNQLIKKRQGGKCAITGARFAALPPILRPSIDRIDRNEGYIDGNMHMVLRGLNFCKLGLGEDLNLVKLWVDGVRELYRPGGMGPKLPIYLKISSLTSAPNGSPVIE